MPGPRKLTETFLSRLPYEGKTYAVRDEHTTGLMVAGNKTSCPLRSRMKSKSPRGD